MDTSPDHPAWQQVAVTFFDYATAEQVAAAHLLPIMERAETDGTVSSWWFIRKAPEWRLRYQPPHQNDTAAAQDTVHRALDTLRASGHIARWVEQIYEPEFHAFGGADAMTVAHHLFHLDSRHILTHVGNNRDQRRELTVLLCSNLMRAAGQDWYEQGDIWARIAHNRLLPPSIPIEQVHSAMPALHRLMTVDAGPTSPLAQPGGSLAHIAGWVAAFDTTGEHLNRLARNGTLQRGVRAVLAHHVLFHWNRLGLPHDTQAMLTHAAKAAVLSA
ncbi:thiopeptide-type bacteriocin biosynthesis protein [Kibdelosporangium phytohabitans]|uniref:Thiopeptide-type bacteriocin biosynthesis domain-containing protein n=1 Tax=Kibdelosporangium phytohabitans TaxID=860235 RepID=A0A0N9HP31_9PSEU|nr:thiopeptide-type bacteriocin biosynthesis protein [Kibdelosporangium phytohabitans]ALG06353.1 hypothetical protein AOZ06_04930 [Kibdelosporangium phytohabitans]MBE1467492.1 thiopeptide-type bacteriocin biosynthesis protein [Kibdelosporangium phytohabitans]